MKVQLCSVLAVILQRVFKFLSLCFFVYKTHEIMCNSQQLFEDCGINKILKDSMTVLSTLKMFRKWEVLSISLYSWLGLLSDILPSFSLKDLFAFIFHTRTETSPKKESFAFSPMGPVLSFYPHRTNVLKLSQRPIYILPCIYLSLSTEKERIV